MKKQIMIAISTIILISTSAFAEETPHHKSTPAPDANAGQPTNIAACSIQCHDGKVLSPNAGCASTGCQSSDCSEHGGQDHMICH